MDEIGWRRTNCVGLVLTYLAFSFNGLQKYLLCASSASSVSLWLKWATFLTTETQRTQRKHGENRGLLSFDRRKMIHPKSIVIVCLVFLACRIGVSSPWRENPLFDRYGDISFEAEKARLDNYAIQLKNAPGSRGFIVVYSGGAWTSSYVKWRAKRAVKYLVQKQGVSADRIKWRYDARCGQGSVLLYLFYPNESDPELDTRCVRN